MSISNTEMLTQNNLTQQSHGDYTRVFNALFYATGVKACPYAKTVN